MPLRHLRTRKVSITGLTVGCLLVVSQLSSAMEAYVGSDADGLRTLYKISFTGANDVSLEPCVQFSRSIGPDEIMMIALRPHKSVFYLFIGPQIVTYNLDTKELERRQVPGRELKNFTEPAFFSPTGRLLYAFSLGRVDAQGLILDADTLEVMAELPYRGKLGSVYAVAFAPNEHALYVAKGNSIVQYPIPVGGSLSLESVSEEATVVAEIPVGTTERLFMQGESLLVQRSNSSAEDTATSPNLIKLTKGDQVHLKLKGGFMPGCDQDAPLCSFDRGSETINVYERDGTLRKKIPAVFTKLLSKDKVEVAHTDSGETFTKLVGVRAYGKESQRFLTGYMSPDGRFAVMVFDNGVRGPSYVAVVDIAEGTVSPALRVGEKDGGITNVVFRDQKE